MLMFIEDVGRHNAVDAIAGRMWLEGLLGDDLIFYTTGRLTSEMVIKGAQMGIPFLLSRYGVTQMGLDMARRVNLSLFGRCSGEHFLIYSGIYRFIPSEQQAVYATIFDGPARHGGDRGLGPVGNAEPCNRHHWKVVGAIANGNGRRGVAAESLAEPEHGGLFGLAINNRFHQPTCQSAGLDLEPVGADLMDSQAARDMIGEEAKPTRHQQGAKACSCCRRDQVCRPWVESESFLDDAVHRRDG